MGRNGQIARAATHGAVLPQLPTFRGTLTKTMGMVARGSESGFCAVGPPEVGCELSGSSPAFRAVRLTLLEHKLHARAIRCRRARLVELRASTAHGIGCRRRRRSGGPLCHAGHRSPAALLPFCPGARALAHSKSGRLPGSGGRRSVTKVHDRLEEGECRTTSRSHLQGSALSYIRTPSHECLRF